MIIMLSKVQSSLLLLSFVICKSSIALPDPVVDLQRGKIKGKMGYFYDVSVNIFLGIPYAEPPLGDLRFKKPIPIEPVDNTFNADRYSPACIQDYSAPYPWVDTLPNKSEDCLYLNIWAPASASRTNRKAVMFWLHGGGFLQGSSRIDTYNGIAMAAVGDVILVSINYRLGPMGFLYSGTEDAPGNMGLYDIIEALKYVRNNIEYFGGDKDFVTVFGQSAGGIAIGMLCTSPLARGLFRRAIMESGTPSGMDEDDNNKNFVFSEKLAKAVGCLSNDSSLKDETSKVINCLRGVKAEKLAKTLTQLSGSGGHSLYPRFGDEVLPQLPRSAVLDGRLVPIDSLMIGVVTNEGSNMLVQAMPDVFGAFGEKNPQINKTFGETIIQNILKTFSDNQAVIHNYLDPVSEDDYEEIRYQVHTAAGDFSRNCPSVYFAESYAQHGESVYFYIFEHRPSNSPWAAWMGIVHNDDTAFIYGYPLQYPKEYTFGEIALSHDMLHIWTNFAKWGNPSYPPWPEYSREHPFYKSIRTNYSTLESAPHKKNCDFFRPYFGYQDQKRS